MEENGKLNLFNIFFNFKNKKEEEKQNIEEAKPLPEYMIEDKKPLAYEQVENFPITFI